MRRTPLALASLVLTGAIVLTGCSSGPTDTEVESTSTPTQATVPVNNKTDCSDLTIDKDNTALPSVSGDAGQEPTPTWTGQEAPTNLTVKTLAAGDGDPVAQDSWVVTDYVGWQWNKDKPFDSSYSRGKASSFSLGGVVPGWRCGLNKHRVGDRLEISVPPELGYGNDESVGPAGTLVFVVEIKDVFTVAEVTAGTKDATVEGEQALADRGITVSGALGASATITVKDGATEPTQPEVIVLARGTGEAVTAQSTIIAQHAATDWTNSKDQSTWKTGKPDTISMASSPALAGLVGVPMGSRVVILLPGAKVGEPAAAFVMDLDRLA